MGDYDAEHRLEHVGSRRTHRASPDCPERFTDPERIDRLDPEAVVEAMNISEGTAVVDFGCGVGVFFEVLSDAVGPTGRVYGTELTMDMLEQARETVREKDLGNVELIQTTDQFIPLPDGIVDRVLLVGVVHEMASPEQTLPQICRILSPNGEVHVMERRKEEVKDGPPIEHLVSPDQVRDWFEEAGFSFEQETEWNDPLYRMVFSKPG